MKISSMVLFDGQDGLKLSNRISLGDIVVLAGPNGSGKTRLIKRLERHIGDLKEGKENNELRLCIAEVDNTLEELLTLENVSRIELVNYSHYDAQLQSPREYTPYVISKAQRLLKDYSYEGTARNALLLLEDMSLGYSKEYRNGQEWDRFVEYYAKPFHLDLTRSPDTKRPLLFTLEAERAALSPGQQYLLRKR